MPGKSEMIAKLRDYFLDRKEVSFAFIFGSYATDNQTIESDIDIAVYFRTKASMLDIETDNRFDQEENIWSDLETVTHQTVDFIVLNRAPATLFHTVLLEGLPIVIKDRSLYLRISLAISRVAEDFRNFIDDYWHIKQRSYSLSNIDRERLIKTIDFLENEIKDYNHFKNLTKQRYLNDNDLRRNVERFIENIVNASIDTAKVLLASEHKKIPQTYKETLANLALLDDFPEEEANSLSEHARLRNILAHEYVDIRFAKIKQFIETSETIYRSLVEYTKKVLSRQDEMNIDRDNADR